MKQFLLLCLTATNLFVCTAQNTTVSIDSLMNSVEYFSDPACMGRLPGTNGYDIAAEFAIKKFHNWGIKTFNQYPDYKQVVPLETNLISGPCDFHIVHFEKGIINSQLGESHSFRGFTGSGEMTVETVFCGFGIQNKDYNDYANVDVKGKAVLIFKGNPSFESGKNYEPFSIRGRAKTAHEHGAAAVIFIPEPGTDRTKPIGSVMCGDGEHIHNLPMLQTDPELTDALFDGSGFSLQQLHQEILNKGKPHSLQLPSKVYINVSAQYHQQIDAYNIIGYIEGADENLKDEFVFITAHLDHVGYQCDVIYPGANDNASGSAAVLEMARLFSTDRPDRSVAFILFTAEESGLHGAQFLADNLPVPVSNIVAAFNSDCIAVGDSIQIGNGESWPELYNLCKSKDSDNLIINRTWGGGGADLTPLHNAGIQGLYFVTRYSYTHLHLPSDTPETLNQDLFLKITELLWRTTKSAASDTYKK